jgi:hypothetical protein
VFLLTDQRPTLRTGGLGTTLVRSDPASSSLLADLRSDKGMEWVPDDMWLTYLQVNTPAQNLDYDLAVSTHDGVLPSARLVGIGLPGGPDAEAGSGFPVWDVTAIAGGMLAILAGIAIARRRGAVTS